VSQSLLDLDLDLDAFSGPFDLLLALVLREEVELVEVPIAAIVVSYLDRLAQDATIDLESVSEFLVLVAALCALKSRLLVDAGEEDDAELDADEAAAELAERLAEYRRFKQAAAWLGARRGELGRRVFRSTPAALAPRRRASDLPPQRPDELAAALGRLLTPPPRLELSVVRGRQVPVRPFLERFRRLIAERGTFVFDEEVLSLDRAEQAAAFIAVLELYKRGEVRVGQHEAFAPIRVARSAGLLHRADLDSRTPERTEPEEAVA
jgi:segregation and condensation protein A